VTPSGGPVERLGDLYGVAPERRAAIAATTEALEAVVLRLSESLPFDAEPWGFGEALWRLANDAR